MTHELSLSDAEVLLGNEQYIDCQRCLGRNILNAHCPDCKAWGVVPNPVYVSVARRAGLPIPRPMEQVKIDEITALEKGWKESFEKMRQRGIKVDWFAIDNLPKLSFDDDD